MVCWTSWHRACARMKFALTSVKPVLGEFELIRHYFAAASCAQAGEGVALGIGDDCALLQVPVGEQLAISTDTLVAGVHFPESPDPFLLARSEEHTSELQSQSN